MGSVVGDAPVPSGLGVGGIAEILATGSVRSVFQPIVDLGSGEVVAYEALARGPAGPLEDPEALFAAASAAGRLSDLDDLCRRAALSGAVTAGLFAPLTVFLNVEPEVVDHTRLQELLLIAADAPGDLQLVLEVTERALAVRPAELIATVQLLRAAGWRIALDDVGASDLSLAFMPLLQPAVIKLDLPLVQNRPGPKVAEIINAVNGYAERTGCVILAEGIENPRHLAFARSLGAGLGQGWWFGRPSPSPMRRPATATLQLPPPPQEAAQTSPFGCLPDSVVLRRSTKALLIELSKHLEREATRLGGTCIVLSTFQHMQFFTPITAGRYAALATKVGFVAAIGAGLLSEPAPGVRGADLEPDDPVLLEWAIAVLAPNFAAALIARDLNTPGADFDRTFDYELTYDRPTVEAAARCLMRRIRPSTVPTG